MSNLLALVEKTIHDEEVSNVDVVESMAELKVSVASLGLNRVLTLI